MDFVKESKYLKNYDIYKEYMDNLSKNIDKTSKCYFRYDWKEMDFHIDSDYYKVVLVLQDEKEYATISKYTDKKMIHKIEQARFIYKANNDEYNMHFEFSSVKPTNRNKTTVIKQDLYYLDNVCVSLSDKSITIDNLELNKIYNVGVNINEIIDIQEKKKKSLSLKK